jgi:hypothetical protein
MFQTLMRFRVWARRQLCWLVAPEDLEYLVEFEHQQFELYEARRLAEESHAYPVTAGGAHGGRARPGGFRSPASSAMSRST